MITKITFLKRAIHAGRVIAAGQVLDLDITQKQLDDWSNRGIATAEEGFEFAAFEGADTKIVAQLRAENAELKETIANADLSIEEMTSSVQSLTDSLETANAALELADSSQMLVGTVKRNNELADCLMAFIPPDEKGLGRFTEPQLRKLAVFVGVDGELPTTKPEIVKAVWSVITAKALAPKKD